MPDKPTFVIVGAGNAGAKAAEALRQEGFDGRVVLIGAETRRPYERPPLSKEHLRGEWDRERVFVRPKSFYADHHLHLATGSESGRLAVPARTSTASSSSATWATPRPSAPAWRTTRGS